MRPSPQPNATARRVLPIRLATEITIQLTPFDQREYRRLIEALRTEPCGYAAREIIQFLARMDYRWFAIAAKGALLPINCAQANYDANLVALPTEREDEFLEMLGQK
jgi:hypothetical protein